jgi:hypothetical protein
VLIQPGQFFAGLEILIRGPVERGLERRRASRQIAISRSSVSVPLTTFLFSCTFPSSATTATWDRLRCTSMPT